MNIFQNISIMDFIVISIALITYFLFLIFRKQNKFKDIQDYLVMGRSLTLPFFIITLVSTWYGSVLGTTQIAFENGIYNFVTQGLFWYLGAIVFAFFFVSRARSTKALSFAEMFTKVYGESTGKLTAVLLFIKILPIPYVIAMGFVISSLTGLPLEASIILGSFIVTLYCMRGGLKNVVITDIFQFFLIYFSLIAVNILSYYKFGGIDYLTEQLPSSYFNIRGENNIGKVIAWLVIALSMTLLSPIFYQRCFAAATNKTARLGIIISMVFWFLSDILTTGAGLYAKAYFDQSHHTNAFIDYSILILPSPLKGLFLVGIFITAFSVLDSYLFIASSTLGYDLFKAKYIKEKNFRNIILIFTASFTAVLSLFFNGKIEDAWYVIESIFLATLLFPLCIGIFKPKFISKRHINFIMISTALFTLLWQLGGYSKEIETLFIGLIFSLTTICLSKIIMIFKDIRKY